MPTPCTEGYYTCRPSSHECCPSARMLAQADRDLLQFKRDVRSHMLAEQAVQQGPDASQHAQAAAGLQLLQSLLDTAEYCLDEAVEAFRDSIQVAPWGCRAMCWYGAAHGWGG